ncbi:hypothetical protein RHGRI_017454 [Rhododendron griersonianum]|uniref:Uncharacterized protein n=1 Tax=Rhododendron griersonianum TaxID=479676 RepID=A0AAV6JXZ9_9ERIC|nr:hypothetical protein RHGRI_017454 [Rhododendron griersonianum]
MWFIYHLGAMETPNRSTNSKGVKVDWYDWESNSESCPDSSEDSQRSNTFGENDVDGEREGKVKEIRSTYNALIGNDVIELKQELVLLRMTPAKRKNPDSTPPPPLRRSKRLAQCQDVAISVDQSSDGRGDEETNVSYSGDSYEEMSKSVSQVDTKSDSDGETYGESKSDGPSGALKLPNLSAFAKRPIIEERSVVLGKLRKITRVPNFSKIWAYIQFATSSNDAWQKENSRFDSSSAFT